MRDSLVYIDMIFVFPSEFPKARPDKLWELQQNLLHRAEGLLGSRDMTKIIYQPQFGEIPPGVINSASGDGAWAQLSPVAAESWTVSTFELAHETVHLLNPVVGHTIIFEEGVAVDFSLQMSLQFFGGLEVAIQDHGLTAQYREAWDLVRGLEGNVLTNAKAIRQQAGTLGNITIDTLRSFFPKHDDARLVRMCERFLGDLIHNSEIGDA